MNQSYETARVFVRAGFPALAVHGVYDDGICKCWKKQDCLTPGKHPVDGEWANAKLIHTEIELADARANNGECNFGIATGHRMSDGRYLLVWDVDVDNGKLGDETMTKLAADGKEIPETLTVRTGGGGRHYFLGSQEPTGNGSPLPGIDIRGLGGQVVAAGSRSGKGVYTIETKANIADAPEWLSEYLSAPEPQRPEVDPTERFREPTGDRSGIERAIADTSKSRSERLMRVGWACARAGLTLEEFEAEIHKAGGDLLTRLEEHPADCERCWAWIKVRFAEETAKHPGVTPPTGPRKLAVTWATEVTPRKVEWTWQDRIPMGELTLTPGRAGIGKSSFHAWCIAKLTLGELNGVHFGTPKNAIIAATEDSWERTIVPRLMAAGADLKRVGRVDVITEDVSMGRLMLPYDTAALTEVITEHDIALISVDPLLSFLNSVTLDTYKSADVRHALEPLVTLAHKTGVVILGNAHFNKSSGVDALSRITGSTAFGEVARAAIAFAQDTEGVNVMSQIKNNLGRTSPSIASYRYEIASATVITADGPTEVGRFRITGDSDRDVDEILNEKHSPSPKAEKADAAMHWCMAHVRAHMPCARAEIVAAGAADGHAVRTLERALADARFIKTKAEFGGATIVSMTPEAVTETCEFDRLIEP